MFCHLLLQYLDTNTSRMISLKLVHTLNLPIHLLFLHPQAYGIKNFAHGLNKLVFLQIKMLKQVNKGLFIGIQRAGLA